MRDRVINRYLKKKNRAPICFTPPNYWLPRPKPGAKNSSSVSSVGSKDSSVKAITYYLSGCMLVGFWNQTHNQGSNSATPIWDASITSSVLLGQMLVSPLYLFICLSTYLFIHSFERETERLELRAFGASEAHLLFP